MQLKTRGLTSLIDMSIVAPVTRNAYIQTGGSVLIEEDEMPYEADLSSYEAIITN